MSFLSNDDRSFASKLAKQFIYKVHNTLMMTKRNLLYILLIILVIGLYFYNNDTSDNTVIPSIDLSSQPLYQSDKMTTLLYDPFGNLSYKMSASKVKYFENSGKTLFEAPNITSYNRENIATWRIKANNATLMGNKILYLNDNVRLINQLPDAQLEKIITDNVKIDLKTQIVTSDDPVTIEGPAFISKGNRLFGNLRNKTADILENVKTYYNANAKSVENTIN